MALGTTDMSFETHRIGTVAFSVLMTFNPRASGDLLVA